MKDLDYHNVQSGCQVSVIVPIYNIDSYVRRCIDSLLKQSMRDIEIILIDDGSIDRCGEICDEYAALDERIRVIHQTNRGLSDARNAGIDVANGEYIMFVDGDDWVEQEFCLIPYSVATCYDSDLVIFQYTHNSIIEKKELLEGLILQLSKDQAVRYIFQNHGAMAWNKLYRRSLLENIRFKSGRFYEDGPFVIDIIQKMKQVFLVEKILYHACYRKDSITHSASSKISNDYYEMSGLMSDWLEKMGYIKEAEWSRLEYMWIYLIRYGRNAIHGHECLHYLLNLSNTPESFKWRSKLLYRILRLSPWLFDTINVIFGRRMQIKD